MKNKYFTAIIAITVTLSCVYCNAEPKDKGARPAAKTTVSTDKGLKDMASFPIGAAVVPSLLSGNTPYNGVVKCEMNSLTGENAMKMDMISKGLGKYDFTDGDVLAKYAQDNGMRMHGHALVWYLALPTWWMKDFSGNREAWINLMTTYITDVVTHFKSRGVTSWDVVNEAFTDDGNWRPCVWYDNIGVDYMDIAFRAAHAADPDCLLFYNDYGMEYSAAKRTAICDQINAMIARGVPVHGIGLQMHVNVNTSKADMAAALNAAAACGVKVHISELDVAVNDINHPDPNLTFTPELQQKQKLAYKNMVEAYLDLPAAQRFGITFWGIDDPHAWLAWQPNWPLPFDEDTICTLPNAYGFSVKSQ